MSRTHHRFHRTSDSEPGVPKNLPQFYWALYTAAGMLSIINFCTSSATTFKMNANTHEDTIIPIRKLHRYCQLSSSTRGPTLIQLHMQRSNMKILDLANGTSPSATCCGLLLQAFCLSRTLDIFSLQYGNRNSCLIKMNYHSGREPEAPPRNQAILSSTSITL